MNFLDKRHLGKTNLSGDSGQSTVEYLIVTFVVVAALVYPTSVFEVISATLKNKYHSYVFGVSISDPPRKKFDDTMQEGAEEVEKAIKVLEKVEDLMSDKKNFEIPVTEKLPSFAEINIGDLVDDLKSSSSK